MEAIFRFITIPRLLYWVLSLNLILLVTMKVNRELVSMIIKHKSRA